MPNYELIYFEFRGRAEAARLVMHYGKIPFLDTKMKTREEWTKIKDDRSRFPYGQVPVLLIDGKPLAQSHSILRYLAPAAGVAGRNPLEAAEIDEIYETCREFFDSVTIYFRTKSGHRPGDVDQLYNEMFIPAVEKQFPVIQRFIGSNGFFHPSGVTYADLYFADILTSYNLMNPEVIGRFPKLLEHRDQIHNLPELQEYLKNRGEQPY